MKNIFLCLAFLLFISGCGNKNYILLQDQNSAKNNNQSQNKIYYENKISAQDRILVDIYNGDKPMGTNQATAAYQDDTRGFLVSQNGTVYLPLVGNVGVAGLSENQATNMLTRYYQKYLKYPFVKVSILNQKVYVLGEVAKPGAVPVVNAKMNLFEVIAQAGDLTNYAQRNEVKIISMQDGKRVVKNIDITNLNSMDSNDITIRPNDIVYIPPKGIKAFNIAINDATPVLDIVNKLISPFVNIKYLAN
jgi:polysaccharide export outer membrane protein